MPVTIPPFMPWSEFVANGGGAPSPPSFILQEDALSFILQEDGVSKLVQS